MLLGNTMLGDYTLLLGGESRITVPSMGHIEIPVELEDAVKGMLKTQIVKALLDSGALLVDKQPSANALPTEFPTPEPPADLMPHDNARLLTSKPERKGTAKVGRRA